LESSIASKPKRKKKNKSIVSQITSAIDNLIFICRGDFDLIVRKGNLAKKLDRESYSLFCLFHFPTVFAMQ
jgi:hypothetical protein